MKNVMFLLLFGFVVSGYTQSKSNKKSNIIFILADDLGYGDLNKHRRRYSTRL